MRSFGGRGAGFANFTYQPARLKGNTCKPLHKPLEKENYIIHSVAKLLCWKLVTRGIFNLLTFFFFWLNELTTTKSNQVSLIHVIGDEEREGPLSAKINNSDSVLSQEVSFYNCSNHPTSACFGFFSSATATATATVTVDLVIIITTAVAIISNSNSSISNNNNNNNDFFSHHANNEIWKKYYEYEFEQWWCQRQPS